MTTLAAFKVGDVLFGDLFADQTERLYRVAWVPLSASSVFLLDITGQYRRTTSRMPRRCNYEDVHDRLDVIPDTVRTSEMSDLDSALDPSAILIRDNNFNLIAALVESDVCLADTLDGASRGEVIRTHAAFLKVTVSRIYRLLTKYWWFGCDRNALLPLRSRQGAPGRRRLGGTRKLGRPNSHARLYGPSEHSGRNVTQDDERKFIDALEEYFVRKLYSLPETYKAMERSHYPIAEPAHAVMPSLDQFVYHARRLISAHGMRRRRLGEREWTRTERPLPGSAADISLGPTDIYDMDGVDLKVEAVTDDVYAHPFGRVSAILVVDRGSQAVVGFHDYVGAEKWDYYRMALYWSFIDTREHLDAIGGHPDMEDICAMGIWGPCNGIYVDRGPGRSRASWDLIVSELKLDRAIAPTEEPFKKPSVESVNGRFQRIVRQLPGGYSRRSGDRFEDEAANARSFACLARPAIREHLISAIAEHNAFHEVPDLLTREMMRNGVQPLPGEIFRWGKAHLRVQVARHMTKERLFLALLPHHEVAVRLQGVRHKNCDFSSPTLMSYRANNMDKKSLTIRVGNDLSDPTRRYWLTPDNRIDVLSMKASQQRKYAGMTVEELDIQRQMELASAKERDRTKRSKAYVSRSQERALAQNLGIKHSRNTLAASKTGRSIEQIRQREENREISRGILNGQEEAICTAIPLVQPDSTALAPPKGEASVARQLFASRFGARKD